MKKYIFAVLFVTLVTMVLPAAVVKMPSEKKESEEKITQNTPDKIKVYIKNEDRVEEMDTKQYLKEVVSAEMPADFYEEALKAQAVAARTYMVNRRNTYMDSGYPEVHKGADICTDPAHCKAWISESARRESWGNSADKNWEKISEAVESTDGVIITYEGKPISAVFHSTSSGHTENAVDVWGGSVPYLVSVASEGDSESPKYNSEAEYTAEEFKKICEKNISGINWDNGLFSDISRSAAGGIISLKIGGVTVRGTEFRTMFALRSTNIDITAEGSKITMKVKGYGHGVGLSQYGANYLASQGKNYEEILKNYYTGVEVKNVYG